MGSQKSSLISGWPKGGVINIKDRAGTGPVDFSFLDLLFLPYWNLNVMAEATAVIL